jgi:hypothetical protein
VPEAAGGEYLLETLDLLGRCSGVGVLAGELLDRFGPSVLGSLAEQRVSHGAVVAAERLAHQPGGHVLVRDSLCTVLGFGFGPGCTPGLFRTHSVSAEGVRSASSIHACTSLCT